MLAAGTAAFLAGGPAWSDGANALETVFEDAFEDELRLDPNLRSIRAVAGDQSRWTLPDEAFAEAVARSMARHLARAQDIGATSDADRLNIELYAVEARRAESRRRWLSQTYPFHAFSGPPASVSFLLTNYHQIQDLQGAEDFIARVRSAPMVIALQGREMRRRVETGHAPPAFNFPPLVAEARAWARGAPFDDGPDHPVLAAFKGKIAALGLAESHSDALVAEVSAAMTPLAAATQALADDMAALAARVDGDRGVWGLPDGEAFYRACILEHTSLDLDPDDLHEFGLAELARTQDEMRQVMRDARFDGDLRAFLAFLRDDPRFFETATEVGRVRLQTAYESVVAEMKANLHLLFRLRPRADVIVKPLPRETEATQGRAFYVESSPDGARPGVFYINLGRPETNPSHQIQAVAYHEAVPGHHMQQAIAAELDGLPRFRRYLAHTCFNEGWALYAEGLPGEIGLYRDPYARAGRLSMEMLRAVRVVADTGIHRKRWTLQRTKAFMDESLANSTSDNLTETRRYFVWPGQALGYQVGLSRIRTARARSEAALGSRFDVRRFHDAVLSAGSLPIPILERRIDAFIAAEGASVA